MGIHHRLVLAGALLAVIAMPTASAGPLVSEVAGSDPDANVQLRSQRAMIGYIDANLNGRVDLVDPHETVYLDLDGSNSVSYRDARLVAFGAYPAGTSVDADDSDLGRQLATVSGWFARGDAGWVADLDNSATLTAGDIRLSGAAPEQVTDGQGLGAVLRVQSGQGYLMVGSQANTFYLDVDAATGGGRVTAGDLRITPGPFPGSAGVPQPSPSAQPSPQPDGTTSTDGQTTSTAPTSDAWRTLDWFLVALTVVNLAGLAFLARAQRPRNPFK